MQSVPELVEKHANAYARGLVRRVVQPGILQSVLEQEIHAILAEIFQQRIEAEFAVATQRDRYDRVDGAPWRNGHKPVTVPGFGGPLTLARPVPRTGSVRLPALEALKAAGRNLRDVLAVRFWLRGASTRAVADELHAALGVRIGKSTVSALTEVLEPTVRAWQERPVPPGIQYLLLDALYLPVRRPGFTRSQALLLAMGIDLEGRKHVLGGLLGDRECEDSWTALIKDLKARGLDRKGIRLVISDEHKAIEAAVSKELAVPHQLCLVHLLRNLKARVARPDWKAVLADLHAIFWAPSEAAARQALGRFETRWGSRYPKVVSLVLRRIEDFLRFFAEPPAFWTALRSTNLLERLNRELRRRLRPAGAMQSELELWKLIWSSTTEQEKRWGTRRVWAPRAARQLAAA
jgi:transposase-like protein